MAEIIEYKKAEPDTKEPQTWRMPTQYEAECGAKVLICCRGCGRWTTVRTHQIDRDGIVTPSLVCPMTGCTEHVWGKLIDWPIAD